MTRRRAWDAAGIVGGADRTERTGEQRVNDVARATKLVHVTTVPLSLGFFRGQIGYLKAHGFEVHAVSSPGDLLVQVGDREAIEVHPVRMARGITPIKDIISLGRLWWLLRGIRPRIVHSHTPKAGLLGTIAARAAGVEVVVLSLFGLPQMTTTGLSRRLLDLTTRLACRLADRVWCDSFSMRDHVARGRLAPSEKLVVLGHGSVNGVDALGGFSPSNHGLSARRAVRACHGIPDGAPVLGFVGRIVGDKGMHELATAWRLLRDHYPSMHLLLVGPFEPNDPPLPDDERLFRSDDRIHLAGPRADVAPYLAAMDLFVMPSHREGFGIVNIEAAAMGLPVVSTRIPGCVDSVQDGLTGTLVPPRDAGALADAIRIYLDDPELRREHGRAGRERVLRDFRPEAIWEALYREYALLLHRKGLPLPGRSPGVLGDTPATETETVPS